MEKRGFTQSTIFSHLNAAIEAMLPVDLDRLITKEKLRELISIFEDMGHPKAIKNKYDEYGTVMMN